jgi:hypothetical protein
LIEVARKKWQLPSPLAETMIPERGSGQGGGGVRGESGAFCGEDDGGEKDEVNMRVEEKRVENT